LELMVCGKRVTKSDRNRKSVLKFGHAGKPENMTQHGLMKTKEQTSWTVKNASTYMC
jgi:hypothetical protein